MFERTTQSMPRGKVSACFVGGTRSGKTEICASFPGAIFVFPPTENSQETLRGRLRADGQPYPFEIADSTDKMRQILDQFQMWAQQGHLGPHVTLCLESLSHYGDVVEAEIRRTHNPRDGRQLWGMFGEHFQLIRNVCNSLPCNVVYTALDKQKTDTDGNITEHVIRLSGREGELLPASCDIVGFCEQLPTQPPQWRCHIQQYGKFRGGTRLRGMPHGSFFNFNFDEHIKPYIQ